MILQYTCMTITVSFTLYTLPAVAREIETQNKRCRYRLGIAPDDVETICPPLTAVRRGRANAASPQPTQQLSDSDIQVEPVYAAERHQPDRLCRHLANASDATGSEGFLAVSATSGDADQ